MPERRSGYTTPTAPDTDLARRVMQHLRGNPLQRFSEPMLARRFAVSAAALRRAMKPVLDRREAESAFVEGSIRVYFAPRAPMAHVERIVGKGVLSGWEAGIRRMAELRMAPRGAGWRL
ncbi:hypothetical protein [Cupriavidus alkaliphilus]|uniref:hypothetical protein n=1 Tax=Cupriavidus alkaliphilus TaxID=942866 RepID=UPI001607C255|nr:hypothetical protein [Cupriavidus alkaliphilus]MBB2918308.1 hypothetical protein [Cupriavidus alkaliphilus]